MVLNAADRGTSQFIRVIRFSQDTTLADALRKTFDGEHPCKVCQLVKAGKQAEKKQDSVTRKVETRLESCLANRFILPDAPARTRVLPAGAAFLRLRSEPPLTPPPRLA